FTTAITSSHSPSTVVNIASVRFGRPEARTTRTASATRSPTDSPVPSGVTENATSMSTSGERWQDVDGRRLRQRGRRFPAGQPVDEERARGEDVAESRAVPQFQRLDQLLERAGRD